MLLELLRGYRIILASGSPRRQELLRALGLEYILYTDTRMDEEYPSHLKGKDIPEYLAKKKSDAYGKELGQDEILITADTIVYQDDEVLTKPIDRDDAISILEKISGNEHHVYTGVCLRSSNKEHSFVASTLVRFGELSMKEIEYYIDNFKPYDKAGAYGIQEWIGFVGVEEIHGSYFNVMGLPIHLLYRELESFILTN